jgi:membrane protein DedA with SNARE-associated domain
MFQFIQNWVMTAGEWAVVGFFVGAFLEELVLPFPSPLLLLGASLFIGRAISFVVVLKMIGLVILPITLGATAGGLVIYGIAYYGGKALIDRLSKWLGFSWDDVERLRQKLNARKSDEAVVFIARCLPFTPTTLITAVAGVVRMNPIVFTLITFLGILVRVSVLFIGAFVFSHTFLPNGFPSLPSWL